MPIIDLSLPISKNKFIRWLQRYVESTRGESIPTSQGVVVISSFVILQQDELVASATIGGISSIPADELAAMSPGSRRLSDAYGNKRNVTGFINFWLRHKLAITMSSPFSLNGKQMSESNPQRQCFGEGRAVS